MNDNSVNTIEDSEANISPEAMLWAEFLYDEYLLYKHKQLLLDSESSKIDATDEGIDD